MTEKRCKYRAWLIISVSLVSMFGLLYGIGSLCLQQRWNKIWKNYYTLLVKEDRMGPETYTAIEQEFRAVHYYNTEVELFDYTGFKPIPIAEVGSRYDSLDPRTDPYIRNVGKYFSSPDKQYAILYIHSRSNPLSLVLRLRKILGPARGVWYPADVHILKHLILVSCFLVLIILCTLISRRNRMPVFLYGLPWLPLVYLGSFAVFAAGSLLYFSFCMSAADLENLIKERLNHGSTRLTKFYIKHILFRFIFAFAALVLFSFAANLPEQAPLMVFLALAAELAVTGILIGRILHRYSVQAHRLFFHIPLGTRRRLRIQKGRAIFPALLLPLVFIIPFILRQFDSEVRTMVPAPLQAGMLRDIDYSGIRKTGLAEEGEIPSLADFVAHRYFQEGYLYRREFRVPQPDERVYLTGYERKKDGKIGTVQRKAFEPGEQWLQSVLREGKKMGIVAMLLDQNAVFPVTYQNIINMPFKNSEIIIYFLSWLWIQFPGFFYLAYLTPVRLYDMKPLELKRRCKAV